MIARCFHTLLKPVKILRNKFLSPNQEKLLLILNNLNELDRKLDASINLISTELKTLNDCANLLNSKIEAANNSITSMLSLQKVSMLPIECRNRYLIGQLQDEEVEKKLKIIAVQSNYNEILKKLRLKVTSGGGIRVAFFVIYEATFTAKVLFEKMFEDTFFEPFIVVIPDTMRGDENMFLHLNKTYKTLSSKYSNVYMSYDFETKDFLDFSENIDMVCSANPYDHMTHSYYSAKYMINQDKIYFFMDYAYMGRCKYEKVVLNLDFYNYAWKLFIESPKTESEICRLNSFLTNTVVSGYCKMDRLKSFPKVKRARKKIIIASHHTISEWKDGLNISTFLLYSDLFLELAKLYPEIDFIFRPHPILYHNLCKDEVWGKEKTEEYFKLLQANSNLIYDTSGDYFDIFVNSDCLIHDCGSFLAEYFYTGNPQCYLLKNQDERGEEFLRFGQEMLDHTYQAYSKEDILSFIDNVVVNGNDIMKQKRDDFAKKEVMYNYPNATDFIMDDLKKAILDHLN